MLNRSKVSKSLGVNYFSDAYTMPAVLMPIIKFYQVQVKDSVQPYCDEVLLTYYMHRTVLLIYYDSVYSNVYGCVCITVMSMIQ